MRAMVHGDLEPALCSLDELGKAMVNQLYDIVCEDDEDTFLTWCRPGVPLDPGDLDELGAAAIARLVDFVPEVDVVYGASQQFIRLSTVYGEILRCSKVVCGELAVSERQKLENVRGLLRTTKTINDVVTGEQREITEDGPMLKAYNAKLADYAAATLRHNCDRLTERSRPERSPSERSASEPGRSEVEAAMDAWVSVGYKHEVDQIHAYVDQVSQRDLVRWKQCLVDLYDGAAFDVVVAGQVERCYHTTLVPADFAAGEGWSRYAAEHGTACSPVRSASSARRSWRAGGAPSFDVFSADGRSWYVGGSTVSPCRLSFELRPVLISRPWFYPDLLTNRGWTLRHDDGWTFDQLPSDGGDPPTGSLVGYPTTILLARDLRIESAELGRAYGERTSEHAGACWGPFSLSGRGCRADSQGVSAPGVQIIGFVNHLLGVTPNPLPELEPERFV